VKAKMKTWTRESWLKEIPDPKIRQYWATKRPLAWILEYQPKILLPGKGLQALDPWPFQQQFLNCEDRYRAINKPRQCGISTIAAAEAAWEFDNIPGAQIMIISKDMDAAVNFHKYIYNILYSVRENNKKASKLMKTNERETTNALGSRIVSLAASKESGRSFSATHLYFDEMAFAEYADDIWQAASAALAKTRGRATVISTPKGRANLFYRIFEDRNHLGFTVFNFAWWDVPDYNPYYDRLMKATEKSDRLKIIEKARQAEWYKSTRPGFTPLQWRQEFEGAFDANAGSVFSERQLEKAFVRNYLTLQEDPQGIFDEWWTSPKQENHLYATATDLGRKNDPTVVITYDYTDWPARVVDFKYIEPGRADWEMINAAVYRHLEFWEPDSLHDGGGVGDTATSALFGRSEPFFFTKASKQSIIELVQHAFGSGKVRLPKIPKLYQEHQRYLWDDKDIVQDAVMANAMAVSIFYEVSDGASVIVDSFDFVGAAQ
jgi:hypothetical protein